MCVNKEVQTISTVQLNFNIQYTLSLFGKRTVKDVESAFVPNYFDCYVETLMSFSFTVRVPDPRVSRLNSASNRVVLTYI